MVDVSFLELFVFVFIVLAVIILFFRIGFESKKRDAAQLEKYFR